MSRSQQLVEVLTKVIYDDASSPLPVANYFLTHDLTGGWEGWLPIRNNEVGTGRRTYLDGAVLVVLLQQDKVLELEAFP